MRKLKLQVQMTVDGFIAGPNGEMDWMVWNWDESLNSYVHALTKPVDTIVLGRKLAEGFIPTWTSTLENPETADEFARKMVETPKVVFTKTLDKSEWAATELATGDLVEEITKIKAQEGRDIIAYGGGTFVSSLIKAGLIDEFHLFVNPVALGQGMPIFKDLEQRQNLTLVKTQQFECGITVLNYVPRQEA
ncbi:dihydrofolate reductase family protein [Rufibacter hautae]|uniref:Dihydrofolate reductase family protein n=1 Tax=Rufibacter hautae TaxID=2595005 RepID=A0A5B6TIM1_9BACT|nr:dihydrofolate reductase family protein [Rufibacter hautae]KAA3439219.1 dihydrofolate reductase family protein [Rufibacter hautae]